MFTSSSRGLSTKLLAVCGALAIVSLSLVFAVGCASGGSEAQTLSGSAKVYTNDEAAAADVGARFFYGPADDAATTLWNEARMVWSTEAVPSEAAGKIGLETADAPTFTLTGNNSKRKFSQITTSANFHIVNNWDRPITLTADATLPEADLVYSLPTGQEILDARLGGGTTTMYQWLNAQPDGYFQDAAGVLFPAGDATPAATVQTNFQTALTGSGATDGNASTYMTLTPPDVTVPAETIPAGAKSQGTGTVTFNFYAQYAANSGSPGARSTATYMVALAFSTYFGIQVNFQY